MGRFSSLVVFASCVLLSSCQPEPPQDFVSEGCIQQFEKHEQHIPKVMNLFLETSGSMHGFMPSDGSTEFQTDIWKLVSRLQNSKNTALSIYQVRETNIPLIQVNLGSFREKMNSGEFQAATSTDIPVMLDSVLAKIDDNSASILISDLIFSPENKGNTGPKIAQITTDIRSRFEGKGLASSLFYFVSSFKGKNVVARPENSPYYVWIIGKQSHVKSISSVFKWMFPSVEQVNFGLDPLRTEGTVAPNIDLTGNATAIECSDDKRFYTWSEYNDEGLQFYIALNLSELPRNAQRPEYLIKNIELEANDAEVSLVGVEPYPFKVSIPSADKKLLENVKATHLVKINVETAHDEETLLQVKIRDAIPGWISSVNSETDDLTRKKTFGLTKMIAGLEEAYGKHSEKYLTQPFKVWISKNSID